MRLGKLDFFLILFLYLLTFQILVPTPHSQPASSGRRLRQLTPPVGLAPADQRRQHWQQQLRRQLRQGGVRVREKGQALGRNSETARRSLAGRQAAEGPGCRQAGQLSRQQPSRPGRKEWFRRKCAVIISDTPPHIFFCLK